MSWRLKKGSNESAAEVSYHTNTSATVMAEFKFFCPRCGKQIQCDHGYSGSQINCPACGQTIPVPKTKGIIFQWTVAAAAVVLVVMLALVWQVWRNRPAVTAFDSFGPGKTFDTSVRWAVGMHFPGYRGQAEWFIPKISGRLSTIEIAISSQNKDGRLNLTISEDNSGIPGKAVESFRNISGNTRSGKMNRRVPAGVLVVESSAHPMLQAETKYWLCAEPANDAASWLWAYNNQNLANGFAFERLQGSWEAFGGSRNGAFSVSIAP